MCLHGGSLSFVNIKMSKIHFNHTSIQVANDNKLNKEGLIFCPPVSLQMLITAIPGKKTKNKPGRPSFSNSNYFHDLLPCAQHYAE